jgi:hypothetical protein
MGTPDGLEEALSADWLAFSRRALAQARQALSAYGRPVDRAAAA